MANELPPSPQVGTAAMGGPGWSAAAPGNTASPTGPTIAQRAASFLRGVNEYATEHPGVVNPIGTAVINAAKPTPQRMLTRAEAGAQAPAQDPSQPGSPYDRVFGTVSPSQAGGGMQLTPPTMIGAHFDPSRVPLRGSTQYAMDRALDNSPEIAARYGLANVQATAAEASAGILEREAERAQYERAQRIEREKERQGVVKEQLQRAKALNEEAQRATVDPNKFFQGPGGIMMAIGAVLRPGNEGMNFLQRAFENNLSWQREQVNAKRQNARDAETTLGKYQAAFGDERAGELAWEADARDIARMKLMALAERSQSPQIMAQADVMGTMLARDRDLKRSELQGRIDQMSYVPRQVVGGGMGTPQKLEHIVRLPNGMAVQMQSKELQQKAIEKTAITEMIRRNNNSAITKRDELVKALKSGDIRKADAIKRELTDMRESTMSLVSIAREQGVVKDAEFERAKESTAAYLSLNPKADDAIRSHTERTVQDLGFFIRAAGGEQVQPGYVVQPGKGIQPTAQYVGHATSPQAVTDPSSFQLQQPKVK